MPRNFRQFFSFFINSFKAQFRTPSSWVWGFIFPVIFIVLFGFVSMNPETSIAVGFIQNDQELTTKIISNYEQIGSIYNIRKSTNRDELLESLKNGSLDVVIEVESANLVKTYINSAQLQNIQVFYQTLEKINKQLVLEELSSSDFRIQSTQTVVDSAGESSIEYQDVNTIPKNFFQINSEDISNQEVRYIDFVLPGILGYSLLSSAVFGVAYSFLSLRKTQVLKRIFAAPTITSAFILGQSMSRFIFIFSQTLLQIAIAYLVFDFRPAGGYMAYFNIVLIMFIALAVFLSFGYIVAGIAKSDETVAPLANLIVLPQFILAGTFFAPDALPGWLQTAIKFLPLYNFNQAMRFVTIDGLDLWNFKVLAEISFLIAWGIFGYFVASKVFKIKDN